MILATQKLTVNEPSTRTINVRLPLQVFQQLERLASVTTRTKSFLAVEALSGYLAEQSWQIQEVALGLKEADEGDFATDAEVSAVFAKFNA